MSSKGGGLIPATGPDQKGSYFTERRVKKGNPKKELSFLSKRRYTSGSSGEVPTQGGKKTVKWRLDLGGAISEVSKG